MPIATRLSHRCQNYRLIIDLLTCYRFFSCPICNPTHVATNRTGHSSATGSGILVVISGFRALSFIHFPRISTSPDSHIRAFPPFEKPKLGVFEIRPFSPFAPKFRDPGLPYSRDYYGRGFHERLTILCVLLLYPINSLSASYFWIGEWVREFSKIPRDAFGGRVALIEEIGYFQFFDPFRRFTVYPIR